MLPVPGNAHTVYQSLLPLDILHLCLLPVNFSHRYFLCNDTTERVIVIFSNLLFAIRQQNKDGQG